MLKLGDKNISKLYYGDKVISKAYLGENLVFQADKPKPYYCEVEYLEGTGTQYINTEYIPISSNLKYETHIYTPNMPSEEQDIIGYFLSGEFSNVLGFYSRYVFLNTKANSTTTGDVNVVSKTFTGANDLYITAELNGNNLTKTLTVNGETTQGTLRAPLSSFSDIKLFTANAGKAKFIGKVYYFKIWENETLVRDFIPVLDWDMKPCMYDKVSNKLYYNEGTGEFTYGRQIHYVEYLATTGTQYIDTNIKTSSIWNIGTECTDTTALRNLISAGGYGGQYVASDKSGKWGLGPATTIDVSSTKLTDLTIEFNFESARSEAIITAEGQSLSRADRFPASTSLKLWIFMSNTIQGFIGKTYYAKCTDDNGKIVRDYLPAIDENGVGFMFDRATHTIFDNAGSGILKVGGEINLANFEIVGTATIDNGIVSNLDETSYITTKTNYGLPTASCWSIIFPTIKVNEFSKYFWGANAQYSGIVLAVNSSGKIVVYISSDGTQWDIASGVNNLYSNLQFSEGEEVNIRLDFTGSKYVLYILKDNAWQEQTSVISSLKVGYFEHFRIGQWTNYYRFDSTMDLKTFIVVTDGKVTSALKT